MRGCRVEERHLSRLVALLGAFLGAPAPAAAAEVVLPDDRIGYWSSAGAYCPNLPFAGSAGFGPECRVYLMFNLARIEPGRVASAFLRLELEGFWTEAETECFVAHDVADSDTDDLLDGIESTAIFADLGDGAVYSEEVCLSVSDRGSLIEVPLGDAALDDIDAAAGDFFPVGIALTTFDGAVGVKQGVRFSFNNPLHWRNELVLTLYQPIGVDVKPGNRANVVMPLARGVVPVAILGSDGFDVGDVDVATLAFGPDGAPPAHRKGGHVRDVDRDGIPDLVAHYRTLEAGIAVGDAEACLTGEMRDGSPFRGCDAVRTLPGGGGPGASGPAVARGCGPDFELAFLVPPLVWLRRRSRRAPRWTPQSSRATP